MLFTRKNTRAIGLPIILSLVLFPPDISISWQKLEADLSGMEYASISSWNRNLYVLYGKNIAGKSNFRYYDTERKKWYDLPPADSVGEFAASAAVNGDIYVAGGITANRSYRCFAEVFKSGEEHWKTIAPMSVKRSRFDLVAFKNKLYAIGGLGGDNDKSYKNLDIIEEYDPATNKWTTKKAMPTARHGHSAAVINNKILVIGGYTEKGPTGIAEEYDPATDNWTTKPPMPISRGFFGLAIVNHLVFAIAGRIPDPKGPIEVYDYKTNTWKKIEPFPAQINRFGCEVIDNTIYIIGGEDKEKTFMAGNVRQ